MRTKTLALSVALGVAGIVGSYAQVYSVNAVGYVNVTLKPGYQIIANQLDNGKGNLVVDLLSLPALVDKAILYKWENGTYTQNAYGEGDNGPEWTFPNMTLAPGEAAFLRLGGTADAAVTFVGEVPQGDVSIPFVSGYNMVSSKVPQVVKLDDPTVGFPTDGDSYIYQWNVASQGYVQSTYDGEWGTGAPTMQVAEGFFVRRLTATTWSRTFSVNN